MSSNNGNLRPLDPNFNMYHVGIKQVEPVEVKNYRQHSRPTSLTRQNATRELDTAMTRIPNAQSSHIGYTNPIVSLAAKYLEEGHNKQAFGLLKAKGKKPPQAGGKRRRTVRHRATLRHRRRRQTRIRYA